MDPWFGGSLHSGAAAVSSATPHTVVYLRCTPGCRRRRPTRQQQAFPGDAALQVLDAAGPPPPHQLRRQARLVGGLVAVVVLARAAVDRVSYIFW
jgi:hypothetical protein